MKLAPVIHSDTPGAVLGVLAVRQRMDLPNGSADFVSCSFSPLCFLLPSLGVPPVSISSVSPLLPAFAFVGIFSSSVG